MRDVSQNLERLTAKSPVFLTWRMFFLFSTTLFFGTLNIHSQCPDTGQTKIIKPSQGTGYYFTSDFGTSRSERSFSAMRRASRVSRRTSEKLASESLMPSTILRVRCSSA